MPEGWSPLTWSAATTTATTMTLMDTWARSVATTTATMTLMDTWARSVASAVSAEILAPVRNVRLDVAPPPDRRAARDDAYQRARALLLSLLTDEMRERFERGEGIEVVGSLGGRYVITEGFSGNVYALDPNGRRRTQYCAHPPMFTSGGRLPVPDAMTGQLLMLLTDEEQFLRVAHLV